MTSSDPNTVTVTALNTHDNPRTAPFVLGTLHMKKELKVDSIIAPATYSKQYTIHQQERIFT